MLSGKSCEKLHAIAIFLYGFQMSSALIIVSFHNFINLYICYIFQLEILQDYHHFQCTDECNQKCKNIHIEFIYSFTPSFSYTLGPWLPLLRDVNVLQFTFILNGAIDLERFFKKGERCKECGQIVKLIII